MSAARTVVRPSTLEAGQRMDSATFHDRYAAMPPGFRAELTEGEVRVASPASDRHAEFRHAVNGLLFAYQVSTPGLRASIGPTVRLSIASEPQPDRCLRNPETAGVRSRIDDQ